MNRLLGQIAAAAGWSPESATARYFNSEKEGLQYLQTKKPGFLLTTPKTRNTGLPISCECRSNVTAASDIKAFYCAQGNYTYYNAQ